MRERKIIAPVWKPRAYRGPGGLWTYDKEDFQGAVILGKLTLKNTRNLLHFLRWKGFLPKDSAGKYTVYRKNSRKDRKIQVLKRSGEPVLNIYL